ncbi:unnamed protein product [Amoebophrya sp. A25]|nr:unnamed protein product [Amoebophrya sp. A25]|eukprot:GSA25T00018415001.1
MTDIINHNMTSTAPTGFLGGATGFLGSSTSRTDLLALAQIRRQAKRESEAVFLWWEELAERPSKKEGSTKNGGRSLQKPKAGIGRLKDHDDRRAEYSGSCTRTSLGRSQPIALSSASTKRNYDQSQKANHLYHGHSSWNKHFYSSNNIDKEHAEDAVTGGEKEAHSSRIVPAISLTAMSGYDPDRTLDDTSLHESKLDVGTLRAKVDALTEAWTAQRELNAKLVNGGEPSGTSSRTEPGGGIPSTLLRTQPGRGGGGVPSSLVGTGRGDDGVRTMLRTQPQENGLQRTMFRTQPLTGAQPLGPDTVGAQSRAALMLQEMQKQWAGRSSTTGEATCSNKTNVYCNKANIIEVNSSTTTSSSTKKVEDAGALPSSTLVIQDELDHVQMPSLVHEETATTSCMPNQSINASTSLATEADASQILGALGTILWQQDVESAPARRTSRPRPKTAVFHETRAAALRSSFRADLDHFQDVLDQHGSPDYKRKARHSRT